MNAFRWMSAEEIPEDVDLRRQGWVLAQPDHPEDDCISLVRATSMDSLAWMRLLSRTRQEARRRILVSGANTVSERATLLAIGFGDVVGDGVDIAELNARARRIAELACWLPRRRTIATLQLDLLARDAFVSGKALGLNPREFRLLWRLADTPDVPVSKQALIVDVWGLGFVPETNSIAVHMSRLRSKLALVGLAGLLETAGGGYCLRCPALDPGLASFRLQARGGGDPTLASAGAGSPRPH